MAVERAWRSVCHQARSDTGLSRRSVEGREDDDDVVAVVLVGHDRAAAGHDDTYIQQLGVSCAGRRSDDVAAVVAVASILTACVHDNRRTVPDLEKAPLTFAEPARP